MRRKIYFLLLVFVVPTKQQYEGDKCTVKGGRGVCRNINDCPSAIEDITNKIMPETCSFGTSDPIVCCKESIAAAAPKITATTTATVTTKKTSTTTEYTPVENDYEDRNEMASTATCPPVDPKLTAPKTGQKAWDKCIDYQEEIVYPCKRSQALIGGLSRVSDCKHSANKYIVNGEDAKPAEFPHMALLGYHPESDDEITFSCGGSVVSDWFILTAGHCVHGGRLGPVTHALLGILRRSDDYNADSLYSIKKIIKHPSYAPPVKYHDIALLQTDRRIKLSGNVVPVCLDVGKQPVQVAIATGWGVTSYAGSEADTLQKVNLTKFDVSDCRHWHKPNRNMLQGFDGRTQICYGDKTMSKDTCGGDSGGPLQVHSAHLRCMYVVVGVTSFGRMCGNVGQPGVYTKIAEYVPWIESIVWP